MARLAFPALILTLVGVAFFPIAGNHFVNWDDPKYFIENPSYRGLSAAHLRWMFTTMYMSHYQPLSWLTHGLVYTFWGLNPTAYHLGNLLLHAANAIAFYALVAALFRRLRPAHDTADALAAQSAAAVGALLFAIHPLRVEAVAWGPERQEVLCGLFFLLTLLAYLRLRAAEAWPSWFGWYLFSLSCFALSLLSKATGIMLPLVLLVLDVYPLRRFAGTRSAARIWVLLEKLPYVGLSIGAGALVLLAKEPQSMVTLAEHGVLARSAQAMYGLAFYLWKTVVPLHLSPLYLLAKPLNPFAPAFVLSTLVVIGITTIAIVVRRAHPWALCAWVCYALIVAPLLGFAQAGPQLVADRYTYLACLPWPVLAAFGLHSGWRAWAASRPRRWSAACAGTVAIAVALALLGVQTARQTRVWHDSLTLWSHVLQIEPANSIAYNNRGNPRQTAGDLDGAIADFTHAIQLNPYYVEAYANRGNARQAKGDLRGALADYDSALQLNPFYAPALLNRGTARQAVRDLDGAIADFDAALRLNPNDLGSYYNRANARKLKGDLRGALSDYSAALRLNPAYASAYNNRGNVRKILGDLNGALADYTAALAYNPRHAMVYNNRGIVRQMQGDIAGAVTDFQRAVQLHPQSSTFQRNLARARQQLVRQGLAP